MSSGKTDSTYASVVEQTGRAIFRDIRQRISNNEWLFFFFIETSTALRKALLISIRAPILFATIMYAAIWLSVNTTGGGLLPPAIDEVVLEEIIELAVLGAVAIAIHSLWLDWDK